MCLILAVKPNVTKLELYEAATWMIVYEVVGSPLPNLTWYRDGAVLIPKLPNDPNQGIRDVRNNSSNNYSLSGRLEFPDPPNYIYNGNYTLIAENVYGSCNRTTHAIIINFPGKYIYNGVCYQSPLLFIIVLKALSREFREGLPMVLLYADDLVLVAETEELLMEKLRKWKKGMEFSGVFLGGGGIEPWPLFGKNFFFVTEFGKPGLAPPLCKH